MHSIVVMRLLPALILLIFSSLGYSVDHEAYRRAFRRTMLHETGTGYHSLGPTAPVHIPGLSGESTPEEIEFNQKILNHPQKCLFQGESSVEGEPWENTARKKLVSTSEASPEQNSEKFLAACKQMQQELGPASCSVIEIAGHAEGFSVGLGEVFGFKVEKGQWKQFPQNSFLFSEITSCLQQISWKNAPVVFLSCGAGSVEDNFPVKQLRGRKLYYPFKHEAQQLMSNLLQRKVYSALGAENVQDWGKHSRDGWCLTQPSPNFTITEPFSIANSLPKPKLNWDTEGKFIGHE